jgi:hypothetical protein
MGFIRQLVYGTLLSPKALEAIKVDALQKINEGKKKKKKK